MDRHNIKRQLIVGYKIYRRKFPHIKLAIGAVALSVILCVLFILRVISKELPRVWVDKIEQELSTDTFAVELDGVSVSLRRGLYLNNLAIYPKRVAERPILNAHQVRLELDIFSKKPIVDRLKSVSIDSFEIASVSSTTVESGVEKASAQEESFVVLPNLKGVDLYCRKARFFKTDAYNIEANISMKDSTIFCNDIVLNFAESNDNLTQNIFGYVKYDVMKNKLEFSGDGKLKTEILLPLFADLGLKGLNRELEKIEFPSVAPDVSAVLKYSPNEAIYNLDLNVNSQHVKYNDVDFVSLVLYLKAHGTNRWSNIDINSLVGRRPEGTLSGSLFIDLDKDVLTFDAISKIRPAHMLTAVGVLDNEERFPLDVELPCQMTASGTVGISKGTANALRIDGNFSARSISFKGMMFENAIGRVDMDYEAWNVNNIEAKLYDGSLNGDISVAPQYVPEKGLSLEKVNFAANFDCKNSSLDTMLRSWSLVKTEDEPFVGLANFNGYLNFDIGNEIDVLRTMVGAAKVDIIDATIYRIPIFAGFTDFMARNVPGLDFILTQNSLKTELNIKDYGVRFENLLVDGPAISITGHGDMWFTGHVDARMRANLLSHDTWVGKGLHFLLFPISKIFELQVYGPINDLSWQTSTLGLSDKETTPEQRGEKK